MVLLFLSVLKMKVLNNPETIQNYLSDESHYFQANLKEVKAIYYPEFEEEVKKLIEEFNKKRCLCTISGAGTSITGTRVPMYGGVVISTEKVLKVLPLEKFKEINFSTLLGEVTIYLDQENLEAYLPAGISLSVLSEVLPPNLFYPPDPTEKSALIGATVATNASGGRSFYYGSTRKWVEGINLVLANGDFLRLNRGEVLAFNDLFNFKSQSGESYSFKIPSYHLPKTKNAAGLYTKKNMDLIDLFIGSEGILGVITQVKVKLSSKKRDFIGDISFFNLEEEALSYVDKLRAVKDKGILSIEYFDRNSLNFIKEKFQEIKSSYQAGVFTEIYQDDEIMTLLSEILESSNVQDDWLADNEHEISKQKSFRHALPEGINSYLKQHQSYKLGTDFVVEVREFPEMMKFYQEIGERFKSRFPRDGFHYVLFGHIGDCHLHFNFITHTSQELEVAKELYLEMALKANYLGGTISGEHGVGKKMVRKNDHDIPYLQLMYGQEGIREIARIKKVFDSHWILNVGNMIPREVNLI